MRDWTVRQVEAVKQPGRHRVSKNLYLQAEATARGTVTKAWLFRYMRHGRAHWHGLGPIDLVTLAEARDAAIACRKTLREGIDPIEVKRAKEMQAKLAGANVVTFRGCAELYIKAHQSGWRNARHASQWPSSLHAHVFPIFGERPVAEIDTALVLQAIEPIWRAIPETASRVRARIEAVLDWAAARQFRSGDNPARWRGHLDKLLPARSKVRPVQHHPALDWHDVPAFMAELHQRSGISARALEFTILTAARSGEAIGARWEEFDFGAKLWRVPGTRMKAGREHIVPLSDRALEILTELPRIGDFVFPGRGRGRPIGEIAMWAALRRMGRTDVTVHGMRSAFKTWASEATSHANIVTEQALAHLIPDKVERAYRRGDLILKRTRLMRDWSKFCSGPATERGGVVQFTRGAAR
jgi:integrase